MECTPLPPLCTLPLPGEMERKGDGEERGWGEMNGEVEERGEGGNKEEGGRYDSTFTAPVSCRQDVARVVFHCVDIQPSSCSSCEPTRLSGASSPESRPSHTRTSTPMCAGKEGAVDCSKFLTFSYIPGGDPHKVQGVVQMSNKWIHPSLQLL